MKPRLCYPKALDKMVLRNHLQYQSTVCLDMTDRASTPAVLLPTVETQAIGENNEPLALTSGKQIQKEGMKGHGLARGSNAGKQGSGIWFAVEGGKPWRSATCISARPDQEMVAAVLRPNIEKCGCPAGHCHCSGGQGKRVAMAISVSWAKRRPGSPRKGQTQ